jgi:hypothetical protein
MRERKATKSDDALVPMSLWEEHLIEDGTREWTSEERKQLPTACDSLRKRMLIWWKGRVLSSFRLWLNKKYEDELKLVNEQRGSGVKWGNDKYVWSHGQYGKDAYAWWWNERMLICAEDLQAGMDAIRRAFFATWWEWEDGSRPFHWVGRKNIKKESEMASRFTFGRNHPPMWYRNGMFLIRR